METHIVNMGDLKMRQESGLLLCLGLGSCVAVALYDAINQVGAMAHVMLPSCQEEKTDDFIQLAKFADVAIEVMMQQMVRLGSRPQGIKATLVGGANMFPDVITDSLLDIGQRNVKAIKRELDRLRIEWVAEETGGSVGRTAAIDIADGRIEVTTNDEFDAEDL